MRRFQSHIWSAYILRSLPHGGVNRGSSVFTSLTHNVLTFLFGFFSLADVFVFFSLQLFVIVVWNFELYMIPLALLLPLAWNYILIASGKDTRQDVVSNCFLISLRLSFISLQNPLSTHNAWLKPGHHCFHKTITLFLFSAIFTFHVSFL